MLKGLRTIVYNVNDLEKAKEWYNKVFGIEPYFDHVQKEEEKHWRLDGLSEHVIAPVIISLDSDDDCEDENSDEEEF